MHQQPAARRDEGAVAVLYAIVLALVLVPLMAVGTAALVRSTTTGELQRAADAGSLAGSAAIPFGDPSFAARFLAATAGGPTAATLASLGLTHPGPDPLTIACDDIALPSASDSHNVARSFAGPPTCEARYLSDFATLTALRACANGLLAPVAALPTLPNLAPLLPVLLRPGVRVTMTWRVESPLDQVFNSNGTTESFTSIAHRRFKNMVVVPQATLPTGDTINLNPYVGDVRTTVLQALDGTEQLLRTSSATSSCADVLAGAQDDILDAVNPPQHGPSAEQILDDAIADRAPLVIARVVNVANALGVPYLDFVPVCAERVAGQYVGHLVSFGSCTVQSPGAFRASLRRS